MEAYIVGISTRKVGALVAAVDVQSGISRSQVSRICADIDVQVQAFLIRPLEEGGYAYDYLVAAYLHGQLSKALQVCSRADVLSMGVNTDGRRELLGLKASNSEIEGFLTEFLVSLKQRGLSRARFVISNAHLGLTKAFRRQLQGCDWQRCRVHFARNLMQRVPKAYQGRVTAALRSGFAQEDAREIENGWNDLAAALAERFSRATEVMLEPRTTCWPSIASRTSTGARS